MEKFTKFRDAGTGIAPFLPIAPPSRTPLVLPFELTLFVLRVPLIFVVFGLEVLLVDLLGEPLLRRVLPTLLKWMRWMFLRAVLFLCGFLWIDEQLEGVSKAFVLFNPALTTRQRNLAIAPTGGNVIASNHTSPFDVMYLAAKCLPSLLALTLGTTSCLFPFFCQRTKSNQHRS
jgi:1-acylglycerol-3-phosphate O-acyltransferase